ncbi:H-NS histone family protein [Roseateles sp. P5_E11]
MASLQDLLAQRAALEQQIAETTAKERGDAIAKVKALMSDYGLTVADLSARTPKVGKEAKVSKVAAKYRNKATGETWSGRGLQPKWLKAAVAGGAKLEDFSV